MLVPEQAACEVPGDELKYQIETLCALPHGWDGRDCPPVNQLYLAKLLGSLGSLLQTNTDNIPSLVPFRSGGLQAEWYYGENDIEVGVEHDGTMFALSKEGDIDLVAVEGVDHITPETIEELGNFLTRLEIEYRTM